MRCSSCGAHNSSSASWCTQCYEPFDPAPAPRGPTEPDASAPAPPVPATGADDPERDVRDVDGTVEWRCRRCGTWSSLHAPACATCGDPRRGFGEVAPQRRVRAVDPALVVGASVVLPGLGHALLGRYGTGAARGVLWSLWLLAGISAIRAVAGGVPALPGIVLLGGAGMLWAATLVDARRLASGDDRQVLGPSGLRWLVGIVVIGLVLAVVAATFAAR